ncbi:tagatose 1,6-diphosphate aldolase [uncultured Friedmanniella sp.]|uniref:tagatose 1,6-diphosphate aldolase n=1 Tax=uncultured Friedmanniella sp. TaxID=335381 RepID=UPI0035CC0801
MKISPGKLWGLRRLADDDGFWRIVATDQRELLAESIAARRGVDVAPYADVAELVTSLATELQSEATAVLLDPIYGYYHAVERLDPHKGLMISYESLDISHTPGGVMMEPIPGWSVAKTRSLGADGVKVLVLYRADAAPEVRQHQEDFVQAAGEECERLDIAMLLEILVYARPDQSPAQYQAERRDLVLAAMQVFRDPKFKVDIYKLEPPAPLFGVPKIDSEAGQALLESYHLMTDGLRAPWVLLSAGMNKQDFKQSLEYAYRCQASGYLAGRALWSQAPELFPDTDAITASLREESLPYMRELNELTRRSGTPWPQHPSIGGGPERRYPLDRDFAVHYVTEVPVTV